LEKKRGKLLASFLDGQGLRIGALDMNEPDSDDSELSNIVPTKFVLNAQFSSSKTVGLMDEEAGKRLIKVTECGKNPAEGIFVSFLFFL
jgi:hypothetical protein